MQVCRNVSKYTKYVDKESTGKSSKMSQLSPQFAGEVRYIYLAPFTQSGLCKAVKYDEFIFEVQSLIFK